jgi:hypothetical protein
MKESIEGLHPERYTLGNVFRRLSRKSDPASGYRWWAVGRLPGGQAQASGCI